MEEFRTCRRCGRPYSDPPYQRPARLSDALLCPSCRRRRSRAEDDEWDDEADFENEEEYEDDEWE